MVARKAEIDVTTLKDADPLEFRVVVREGAGETQHRVTMSRRLHEELAAGERPPEQVVRAAFRFLLDRESKEAILRAFDVAEIGRYFPGYEEEIGQYLIGAF